MSSSEVELRDSALTFTNLPYDIRYMIYQHLFPSEEQIYIQALSSRLTSITPKTKFATNLLLVNRAIGFEASEYLYNGYLFNIVGRRKYCFGHYNSFITTMEKYSRNGVRIDAFHNGWQSSTMCMSLQAGEAKLDTLQKRGRGEPMSPEQILEESARLQKKTPFEMAVELSAKTAGHLLGYPPWLLRGVNTSLGGEWLWIIGPIAVLLLAWMLKVIFQRSVMILGHM
ncbi:MAG: hypothetical protein M1820_005194 [Bogoriella megaspora]|nr:MAG: hypothetical protein M1820_005194 [Bogoriella megaspora]